MTAEHIDPASCTVHVEWTSDDVVQNDFTLADVATIKRLAEEHDMWPLSFTTPCKDLAAVLELLSPLADQEYDELEVNGVAVGIATHVSGGHELVPLWDDHDDIEILGRGSASWLSGGPCVFDQSERLMRLGNLYWVDTSGDVNSQRVVVGRFNDTAEGITAAVASSHYFSLDDQGNLTCELDDWPQEE